MEPFPPGLPQTSSSSSADQSEAESDARGHIHYPGSRFHCPPEKSGPYQRQRLSGPFSSIWLHRYLPLLIFSSSAIILLACFTESFLCSLIQIHTTAEAQLTINTFLSPAAQLLSSALFYPSGLCFFNTMLFRIKKKKSVNHQHI